MKNLILLFLVFLLTLPVFSQRKVEETYRVRGDQNIRLEFKFADDIRLVQWDRKEVKVAVKVHIDDGAGNEFYSLQANETGGIYTIQSDFGNYFKKKKNQYNTTTRINYVVHIPKQVRLAVKSISGDLFAESFQGQLKTDLVSGDVEIKSHAHGELKLKTVSGDLDVAMNRAKIDAKTVTGTIYSDLDIAFIDRKEKSFDSHIRGIVNNGDELVKMETVSGNIYLRRN